jgi:hypothetical protein
MNPRVVIGLLLTALLSAPASAQPRDKDLWTYAGAGFSRALNPDMPGGSVLLHGGVFHRPRSMPKLAFGAEIGWLSLGSSTRRKVLPGYGGWEQDYSVTATPVCAQLFYAPPARVGRPSPMVTAGLGLYALKTEWENRRSPTGVRVPRKEVKSESDPGANCGVGIALASRAQALRAGLDVRYHFVLADGRSLGLLAVAGRVYL